MRSLFLVKKSTKKGVASTTVNIIAAKIEQNPFVKLSNLIY